MTGQNALAELQLRWASLLEEEERLFQHCCTLDRESPERTDEKSSAVREWWRAANAIIWLHVKTRAQHNHELLPYPMFVLGRLANICEEVSNGNIPSFVTDAAGGGRPWWRKERHHIAYGVLYIEAVRAGHLSDRSPVKTVRLAYNVTAKAVQNWLKRRDEICIGVPAANLTPEQLREMMLQSASVYSRIGRGAPSPL